MCELSNEQVFSNWQECQRTNRQQGADYWLDFLKKRVSRGGKDARGAQEQINKIERCKE